MIFMKAPVCPATSPIVNFFDNILSLHQESDFNWIGTQRICLLTIFYAFLVVIIVRILYAVPDHEDKNPEENDRQIQYNDPNSNLAVNRITLYANRNFLPYSDYIEVLGDSHFFRDPQQLVQEEEKNKDSFKSGDAADHAALTAVKTALQLKQRNDFKKAQKLFQHAIALSPKHPDVLLHYGEFLESDGDLINADHFYVKASKSRPNDSQALGNHKRILPVVNQLDLQELKRIDAKKDKLLRMSNRDLTFGELKKQIYFQHIYHTVAIGYNTMTPDEARTIIETPSAVPERSNLENKVLGVKEALCYVYETLANEISPITVNHILEIHKRVMQYVEPSTAGKFRESQVHVGHHTPPAASEVETLMDDYVAMISSPNVRKMHPIYIAALVHYKLVFIHPFLDGNGRTARALMNLIFLRYEFPSVDIRKGDRNQYLKCLRNADGDDLRPFYRFITEMAEYSIDFLHFAFTFGIDNLMESTSDITDIIPL